MTVRYLTGDVAYSLGGDSLEQEVGHDNQGLIEEFRKAIHASRSVKVQGGPPICGIIPGKQREAKQYSPPEKQR